MENKLTMQIIRSNRRTVAIEITKEQTILVRAPLYMSDSRIMEFAEQKRTWIEKHIDLVQKRSENKQNASPLTNEQIHSLAEKARILLPEKVAYYAPIVGVNYGKITIRNQVSRWGSCSAKGNLNFNCLLMLTPPEIVDYVVVHELCHRIEMNHSSKFWNEVCRVIPNYKKSEKWLKDNGCALIDRMAK